MGTIGVSCAPGSSGPPRVAYAIGRDVGTAVVRNRLRRRLRASIRAHEDLLVSGAAYLVRATPAAVKLDSGELDASLAGALGRVHARLAPGDQL